jgi:outer membrane lipoprotein-sorting protein
LPFRRALLCLAAAALLAPAVPAGAADPLSTALSAEDKALVQSGTDYIQNLKGVQGRFTQTDPRGKVSTGLFYMLRPGRARFQYDPPAALLVVADGMNVSIYDRKLKTFDQYPLGQTPLVLLLAKTVRLDHGVVIAAVQKGKDNFSIDARDARKEAQGRIIIQFSQQPMALKGWTVVDAQGQKTEVKLGPLTEKSTLDANLFVLRDPRARSERP